MSKPFLKRLNNDQFIKNKHTFTESLTVKEIEQKLENYTKVDNITEVTIGTHLRYFDIRNETPLFRMGGVLHKNSGLPDYVVLSNGSKSWSVQTEKTIFFKKMTVNDIKSMYESKIEQLENDKHKLKKLLQKN